MTEAIFIDKDGTLIKNDPYNVIPEKIQVLSGVREGLPLLSQAGYKLIIISNQAGVALGRFEEQALQGVRKKMEQIFQEIGVSLDGFYYCPHHPEGTDPDYRRQCTCRKPRPGLLLKAKEELHIDLHKSWLIGDILDDIEAGRQAGCQTLLIDNGNETEWLISPQRTPHHRAKNFLEACRIIVKAREEIASRGQND